LTAANVNVTGNIGNANVISANTLQIANGIFWANGVAWSSGGGTTYANANVTAFLSNSTASTGNIYAGNVIISGTEYSSSIKTGSITATGTIIGNAAVGSASSFVNNVGFVGMPVNAQTGTSYTTALSDQGGIIYSTGGGTITIPANSSVPFPVGTVLSFFVSVSTSIAITTDTMYLAGSGSTGTRTLAAWGVASAIKVASTTWVINGNGLT
jgi:hypothetical protein